MRAAKVQASLRIRAVSPEPSLLAHISSESRGNFRQKARSLAPLNGLACAAKICHNGMLEDTNSLVGAHINTAATHYPDQWRDDILKPLYKRGDDNNPENYRGIVISSCLSQFSRILHSKFKNFITQNDVLLENQIGFRKSYRTADHILTLKAVIDMGRKSHHSRYLLHVSS